MPAFESRPFRRTLPASSSALTRWERLGARYRAGLNKHPFMLFGLPFISLMVAASFLLTPATALRYERHDRKNREVTKTEALELGLKSEGVNYNPRRRVLDPSRAKETEREEYYRLMAKDIDNWEQKRVERFKGEPDGRL